MTLTLQLVEEKSPRQSKFYVENSDVNYLRGQLLNMLDDLMLASANGKPASSNEGSTPSASTNQT